MQRKTSIVVSVVSRLRQSLSEAQAVLINGKVYAGRKTSTIWVYDTVKSRWSKHHDAPVTNYAIASYKGKLVLVGGTSGTTMNSRVHVWEAEEDRWNGDDIPQLNDARDVAVAVEYKHYLIVCGGRRKGFLQTTSSSKTVEVYDGQSWHYAASMPQDGAFLQATVSGGYLYVLNPSTRWITYCSLDALIASSLGSLPEFEKKSIWKTLPHQVHYLSGCLTVLGGCLVAVAGINSRGYVFMYYPAELKWASIKIKGPTAISPVRNPCSVILSDTEVLICGGDLDIMAAQANTLQTYSLKLE